MWVGFLLRPVNAQINYGTDAMTEKRHSYGEGLLWA